MPPERSGCAQDAADRRVVRQRALAVAVSVVCALSAAALAQMEGVQTVRARQVDLSYHLRDAGPDAEVELWYTRDGGATWQLGATQTEHNRPLRFEAPAEGLYGFVLIVRDNGHVSAPPPDSHTQPQRRVFIDYTPPLVQWDGVEPADGFASRRMVHLRWTAHDDNFPGRPVSLSYQSSIDQAWHVIESAMPNVGQYDWTVPPGVAGQITLKLAVRDQGGHVVERLHGPVAIDRWLATGIALRAPATQPAGAATGNPATQPAAFEAWRAGVAATTTGERGKLTPKMISPAARQQAERLWAQGNWHANRNEYAVAGERFREALQIDPNHVPALYDLGALYYMQKEYPKAIEQFKSVLAQDAKHQPALWGLHEAYVSQKQYSQSYEALQQLLKLNDRNAQAWLDLGDDLLMMGDPNGARANWTQAMKADPSAKDVTEWARTRLDRYGLPVAGHADNSQRR